MGFWWRLRQWAYARPPVVAAAAAVSLLIVGLGGWESARWFSDDSATQAADAGPHRVAAANTIHVDVDEGAVVTHVVRRTRIVARPGKTSTVVVTANVTRAGPTTHVTQLVPTVLGRRSTKTVTDERTQTAIRLHAVTQTIVRLHAVTQTVKDTQTIRQTVTIALPAQTPPGHADTGPRGRPTETVTVIQTVTQPAATVTVTTSKGH
jgi:hypothetical protein